MGDSEAGRYWEQNAAAWTRLSRRFHRPISVWLNSVIDAGFIIEEVAEPCADPETAARFPEVADTRVVAYFLHVRARKSST